MLLLCSVHCFVLRPFLPIVIAWLWSTSWLSSCIERTALTEVAVAARATTMIFPTAMEEAIQAVELWQCMWIRLCRTLHEMVLAVIQMAARSELMYNFGLHDI